jgi:HD superfamily phosphohydrolase
MCTALHELKSKGVDITAEESLGARIAILLHDIGHGPFSHALENELVTGVRHEEISLMLMNELNREMDGALDIAIAIFTDTYPKRFLHQLVSGQLDVDRMDYLNRDSFFTGVAEGVIGYDRIIKMLTVNNGELMVEEKAIYSIEKFLVSRRLMYWQVYLHKTVLAAEMMLVKVIKRARELIRAGEDVSAATTDLDFFLAGKGDQDMEKHLGIFCRLDDHDMMATLKKWSRHKDPVLGLLCRSLVERKLYKARLSAEPFAPEMLKQKINEVVQALHIPVADARYFAFTGETINTTYDPADERINILFKDGTVRDISEVDNALIHQHINIPVKKYYICYWRT